MCFRFLCATVITKATLYLCQTVPPAPAKQFAVTVHCGIKGLLTTSISAKQICVDLLNIRYASFNCFVRLSWGVDVIVFHL
jgi:hypothetical protein